MLLFQLLHEQVGIGGNHLGARGCAMHVGDVCVKEDEIYGVSGLGSSLEEMVSSLDVGR